MRAQNYTACTKSRFSHLISLYSDAALLSAKWAPRGERASERYNVGIHAGIATGAVNTRKLTRHHPGSKLCFHGAKLDGHHRVHRRDSLSRSQDVCLTSSLSHRAALPAKTTRPPLFRSLALSFHLLLKSKLKCWFCCCDSLGFNFSSSVCLADGYSFQLVVCFNLRWSYSYLVWVGEVGRRGMWICHKLCMQECAPAKTVGPTRIVLRD